MTLTLGTPFIVIFVIAAVVLWALAARRAQKQEGGSQPTVPRPVSYSQWMSLLFISLKLTDQINWSWAWVLCPLWSGLVFHVVVGWGKSKKGGA